MDNQNAPYGPAYVAAHNLTDYPSACLGMYGAAYDLDTERADVLTRLARSAAPVDETTANTLSQGFFETSMTRWLAWSGHETDGEKYLTRLASAVDVAERRTRFIRTLHTRLARTPSRQVSQAMIEDALCVAITLIVRQAFLVRHNPAMLISVFGGRHIEFEAASMIATARRLAFIPVDFDIALHAFGGRVFPSLGELGDASEMVSSFIEQTQGQPNSYGDVRDQVRGDYRALVEGLLGY